MAKVLIATEKPFAPVAVESIKQILTNNGFETVLLEKYTDKAQLLDAVKDVEGIIVRSDKIDAEVIEAAKQLKIVVRAGAGYDNVDCDAATKHGICVMNTPGQNSNAVAELVFALLLFHFRTQFDGKSGKELMGKSIGIMSYGNIGTNVARIAKGFGMKVNCFSRSTPKDYFVKDGYLFFSNRKEINSLSDILVLAMPSAANTKKMVDATFLSEMPTNAILVNIARTDLIDEDALIEHMRKHENFVYITDVKPKNEAPFIEEFGKRYLSTVKKSGAQTAEANINAGLAAAKQIAGYINNGEARYRVNK